MQTPIIKLTNLHKSFHHLHVLKGINLDIHEREVICVIGRSGSGKSTMLRCINFLEEPSVGEIEIANLKIPAGGKGKTHQELVHQARDPWQATAQTARSAVTILQRQFYI